jgi:hypothetical protein
MQFDESAPPAAATSVRVISPPSAKKRRGPAAGIGKALKKRKHNNEPPIIASLSSSNSASDTVADARAKLLKETRGLAIMTTMLSSTRTHLNELETSSAEDDRGSLSHEYIADDAHRVEQIADRRLEIEFLVEKITECEALVSFHQQVVHSFTHPAEEEKLRLEFAELISKYATAKAKIEKWKVDSIERIVAWGADSAEYGTTNDEAVLLLYQSKLDEIDVNYKDAMARHEVASREQGSRPASQLSRSTTLVASSANASAVHIRKMVICLDVQRALHGNKSLSSAEITNCGIIAARAISEADETYKVTENGPAWFVAALDTASISVSIQGVAGSKIVSLNQHGIEVPRWLSTMVRQRLTCTHARAVIRMA